MKLRTKLTLSFAVVVMLVGGIGLTSSFLNESVKDRVTRESEIAINEIELAGELGLQLYQSLTRAQYLIEDQYRQSLPDDFNESDLSTEYVIREIDHALLNFEEDLQSARKAIYQEMSESTKDSVKYADIMDQVDSLEDKFNIYRSLINQLQELSNEDYGDAKEFFTVTIEPYFRTSLLPLIHSVRTDIKANHQAKIAELNDRLDTVSYWLGIATIIALGITISLTFFLYRSIANPLNQMADAAKKIGQGNLNKRINHSSNDELGQLSQTFNWMAKNLNRTTVSRDYVDSIIESMADLLVVTDEQLKITRINSAGLTMLNRNEEDLLGQQVDTIFKGNRFSLAGNGTGGKAEQITSEKAAIPLENGSELPVSLSKGVLKANRDKVEGYVFVASDISSERQAQQKLSRSLKEKQVMLAEIHHRVKNNLAVISGLLQMQIWEADNEYAASALQESQMRVQSIALVHEKLYQTESLSYIQFDHYIHELLEAVRSTYLRTNDNVQITTDLEEVFLNINQAIPCALLMHELVANALKHAFTDQDNGTIHVSVTKMEKDIHLKVTDNGRGLPDTSNHSDSLGMSLVKTLCKQLKGNIKLENNNGAEITVIFKLEDVITD